MSAEHVEVSRFLSYVLRHRPEAIGLELDTQGWAEIDALIAAAGASGRRLEPETIRAVVEGSDKKRFALSADGRRIRAVQGHSVATVDIHREPKTPPKTLFHGTATRFLASIQAEGLRRGRRHHVHLSADPATAEAVGRRYGTPVVLVVEAGRMHEEGLAFFQADNGVWLTDAVPPRFLRVGGALGNELEG
ncbi:RNA 2'-phosphotransferase [Herbiconiux sp. A18JL235]|uniref:Probable RNA 2'-phosphotransferase n=1 Tax=Herbiconiux sp. A18JL235 TaxID=3152363 RepID=A0AB39BM42_9MICO